MASFSPSPCTSPLWQLSSSHSLTLPPTSPFLRLHSRFAILHVVRTRNANFDPLRLGDDDDDDNNGNDTKFVRRRRNGRRLSRQGQWWSGSNQVEGKEVSGIVDQLVDGLWILQVFRSYGVFLPIILISLLLATGPKAFLMGSGVPIGLSLLAFGSNKLSEWLDSGPTSSPKPKNRLKISRFSRKQAVSEEGRDSQTPETNQDKRHKGRSYQTRVNRFRGWDELVTEDETDSTHTPSITEARLKMMRESKLGNSMEDRDLPFRLRELVALFPLLGSWTNLW